MGVSTVCADAKDLCIYFCEFVTQIPHATGLFGSARGVVFRVKEKHHPLALVVR
jgi:hypothetical protein